MILRSAILGLVLSIGVIIALVFYPQQTTDPFLEELKELAMSGDQIPLTLFPMFPWDGEQPEQILAPAVDLIRIRKDPQSREISAGSILTFRIVLENISNRTLHNLTVEDRLDTSLFSVINTPGGESTENRITWDVPVLAPGQSWTANYVLKASEDAPRAPTETTTYVFGEDIADMPSATRLATTSITIIPLPETGVALPWGLNWIRALL